MIIELEMNTPILHTIMENVKQTKKKKYQISVV